LVIAALDLEFIPQYSRSKYFEEVWEGWRGGLSETLSQAWLDYPQEGLEGYPTKGLAEQGHPLHTLACLQKEVNRLQPPQGKNDDGFINRLPSYLYPFHNRLKQIDAIESERREAEDQYQKELAEYQAAVEKYREVTALPIDDRITLVQKYSIANENQLYRALEKLEELVSKRQGFSGFALNENLGSL
jgi:hypothetical protein